MKHPYSRMDSIPGLRSLAVSMVLEEYKIGHYPVKEAFEVAKKLCSTPSPLLIIRACIYEPSIMH